MNYAEYQPTPIEAVDELVSHIEGKVVYDLGAGEGAFLEAVQPYAKDVVAIEFNHRLAEKCRERGLYTIEEDFVSVNIHEADVIFCFLSLIGNYTLTKKLKRDDWHGTVISHFYPLQDSPLMAIPPDEVIDVNDRIPFLIYNL